MSTKYYFHGEHKEIEEEGGREESAFYAPDLRNSGRPGVGHEGKHYAVMCVAFTTSLAFTTSTQTQQPKSTIDVCVPNGENVLDY